MPSIPRREFLHVSMGSTLALATSDLVSAKTQPTSGKSVILLWMNGGPSHIDMWDPKPDAPVEIRGPFSPIATRQPGVFVSEHLPGHARIMDKLTLIRSIDCTVCQHDPNQVMQTGNPASAPRTNPKGQRIPAIGSIVAKFRGSNQPGLPPYVTFHVTNGSIARAGDLGQQYDPYHGNLGASPFIGASDRTTELLLVRRQLMRRLDRFPTGLNQGGADVSVDRNREMAMEIVLSGRARTAFDLDQEPTAVREEYNRIPWIDQFGVRGQMNDQVLLARRLVQAGVTFVTVVLSAPGNSATWDTHGNPVPSSYGGIENGLKPLLAPFDHLLTTLVEDLEQHGLIDDTLVVSVGEFGRSPKINTQTGRDHWNPVGDAVIAGGGYRHGQTIGSTDRAGGAIKSRPLLPGDLAATIYHHLGIPLETSWRDPAGRPHPIVPQGQPIAELMS